MPRSTRMRHRKEFLQVRRRGKSIGGRYLVLAFLHDAALADCRFGFITSKRVGNAVHRNRLRRRMRSIVRKAGPGIVPGHYVVTIARVGSADAEYMDLENEWIRLATRSGLVGEQQDNDHN